MRAGATANVAAMLLTLGVQALAGMIPRGTLGTPEEIASVALSVGSDDLLFVNGVELFVDGGTSVC